MKKWTRLCGLLAVLLMLSFTVIPLASAETEQGETGEPRVYDSAGLFSAEECAQLEDTIAALRASIGMEVAVATTDDAGGLSARNYADGFLENSGTFDTHNGSGVLFLIDMDNREAYISTYGKMIDYLTDSRIDSILDDAYTGLSSQDYAAAAQSFLAGVKHYVAAGIPEDHYRYNEDTGEITRYRSVSVAWLVGSAIVALLIGVITCVSIRHKYTAGYKFYQYPFRQNSEMALTRTEDNYVRTTLTHRHIPPPSSSSGGGGGGGSSTHTSSGGSTFGGGGRSFLQRPSTTRQRAMSSSSSPARRSRSTTHTTRRRSTVGGRGRSF